MVTGAVYRNGCVLDLFNADFNALRVVDVRNEGNAMAGEVDVVVESQGQCGQEYNGIYVQRVVRVKLIADLMQ